MELSFKVGKPEQLFFRLVDIVQTDITRADLPLILAIDIGTSSIRSLLFDRLGRCISEATSRQPINLEMGNDGRVEIATMSLAESCWYCIDETLEKAGNFANRVAAVAMCTFVSNILGVDKELQPITPVYTYADTRPSKVVPGMRASFNEEQIHQRTGCVLHATYLPVRFIWLAQFQPEVLVQVQRWMTIGEFLYAQLFGETAVSYSVASWSGLFNRTRFQWDDEILSKLPLEVSQLSQLVELDHGFQGLRAPFAQRWPALKEIPWYPAVGDGAAANIGSGCINHNQVAISMGTSSAVRVVIPDNILPVPSGLWAYCVDRQLALVGGALSEGGSLYAWLVSVLNLTKYHDLEASLAKLLPAGHRLTLLPLLAGERSPRWRGDARGMISGITIATTPLEILRAGMESVVFRIAEIYQLLTPLLATKARVIASGGALSNSKLWTQMLSDTLGKPVALSLDQEASARGAAMLAQRSLGLVDSLDDFPLPIGSIFKPNLAAHKLYLAAMQEQRNLYEKVYIERSLKDDTI